MTDKEIIRALRICATHKDKGCGLCPQRKYVRCTERLADEAITMIERLTAENVVLPDGQASAIESLRKEIEWKDMVIALAQKEQEKAEAGRDAALADLADARSCKTCKYACDTRDCSSCKSKTCKCRECHLDKNAWEWRGLPETPEEGEKA
jgi:hypothetical protein